MTTTRLSMGRLAEPAVWRRVQRELGLSDRETQVAIRLLLGDSVRQVAQRLGIAPSTVVTYLRRLRTKTQTNNRASLVLKLIAATGLLLEAE